MIITLLRFIYLTLPICAGIELKTLSKEEKQRNSAKVNSTWRVEGVQRRAQVREHKDLTRIQHATASRRRADSQRRVKELQRRV